MPVQWEKSNNKTKRERRDPSNGEGDVTVAEAEENLQKAVAVWWGRWAKKEEDLESKQLS